MKKMMVIALLFFGPLLGMEHPAPWDFNFVADWPDAPPVPEQRSGPGDPLETWVDQLWVLAEFPWAGERKIGNLSQGGAFGANALFRSIEAGVEGQPVFAEMLVGLIGQDGKLAQGTSENPVFVLDLTGAKAAGPSLLLFLSRHGLSTRHTRHSQKATAVFRTEGGQWYVSGFKPMPDEGPAVVSVDREYHYLLNNLYDARLKQKDLPGMLPRHSESVFKSLPFHFADDITRRPWPCPDGAAGTCYGIHSNVGGVVTYFRVPNPVGGQPQGPIFVIDTSGLSEDSLLLRGLNSPSSIHRANVITSAIFRMPDEKWYMSGPGQAEVLGVPWPLARFLEDLLKQKLRRREAIREDQMQMMDPMGMHNLQNRQNLGRGNREWWD